MRFQVFPFASKKVQGFSSDKKMSLLSVLFHLQNQFFEILILMSQFFEILIFSQDIWGNVQYVPQINLISQGTLIKVFYFPNKTKSETRFCRRKAAEDNNAKNRSLSTPPLNIRKPGLFLSFQG